MGPRERPIGVRIALAYLLLLLALAGIILVAPIPLASAILAVPIQSPNRVLTVASLTVVMTVLLASSLMLLWRLNQWAVLTTGAIAGIAGVGVYLSSLPTEVTALYSAAYMRPYSDFIPLFYLAGTTAVFLYAGWLWRKGVLK